MNFHTFIHPCSEYQPPNCAGPMDNYYAEALRDYAAMNYEALHSYLIEGLRYQYELFPPLQEGADVDEADAPAENARESVVVRADTVPPPTTFNMVFR